MTERVSSPLRRHRLAAISALAALGVAISGSAVQSRDAEDSAAIAAVATPLAEASLPGFTPSEEARFEEAFAHLEGELAAPVIPDHAVDMAAIEPPRGPLVEQDLGGGIASYYGARFAGRPTASGEAFNPGEMTAAHKTLPFGSRVRVTNPRNGRSVIVRINDRGPFVRGRVIDLSRAAAEEIGMIRAGHASVELELLAD